MNAVPNSTYTQAGVSTKNTLTRAFSATNLKALFIGLNSSDNPVLSTTQFMYIAESSFDMGFEGCSVKANVKNNFDGLIHINKTASAALLIK